MGIYPKTELVDDYECTDKMSATEAIFLLYLDDQTGFDAFKNCFNSKKYSDFKKILIPENFFKKKNQISGRAKKLVEIFNSVTKKITDRSQLYLTLKELKGYKNLLARLIEAYVYMRMANSSKSQDILIKIVDENFFEHIYNSDLSDFPLKNQMEMFIYLLKSFEEDLGNEKLFNAVVFYFYSHMNQFFQEKIDEEFDLPQGFKSIRNHYRSNTYGKRLPYAWGLWVFENSSQKELINYLSGTPVFDNLFNNSAGILFYRSLSNIPKEQQKKILELQIKLKESSNLRDQFYFYEMVEDDTFYKFLMAHTKLEIGIITAGKRKLYRKLKEIPALKHFAIFQLLNLGDEQKEYLTLVLNSHE